MMAQPVYANCGMGSSQQGIWQDTCLDVNYDTAKGVTSLATDNTKVGKLNGQTAAAITPTPETMATRSLVAE